MDPTDPVADPQHWLLRDEHVKGTCGFSNLNQLQKL
jgi:hypothetical protein